MLDAFLEVGYVKEAHEETLKQAVDLLKGLPRDDLAKLVNGEKLAWLDSLSSSGSDSFLDKFQGSPLFEEALALENEELQMEMTDIEQRKEDRVKQQAQGGVWEARDQIRVKKRLLELRLAQEGAGMGDQAGGGAPAPLNAAPMPNVAAPGALGLEGGPVDAATKTAFLAPVIGGLLGAQKAKRHSGSEAQFEGAVRGAGGALLGNIVGSAVGSALGTPGLITGAVLGSVGGYKYTTRKYDEKKKKASARITSRIKRAMAAGEVVKMTSLAKKLPGALPMPVKALGALGGVNKQLGNFSSLTQKVGSIDPAMFKRADAWGRELARVDFTKAAHAADLERAAKEAGQTLAHGLQKEALGGIAGTALGFARKSKNLGTMVGAGMGAVGGLAHGMQRDEQGQTHMLGALAEGVGGAALGAGAGHAAQGIGRRMNAGRTFSSSVKGYGKSVGRSLGGGGAKTPRVAGATAGTPSMSAPAAKAPKMTSAPPDAPHVTPNDPSISQIQEKALSRSPPPLPREPNAAFMGAPPDMLAQSRAANLAAPDTSRFGRAPLFAKAAHAFGEAPDLAGRVLARHAPALERAL